MVFLLILLVGYLLGRFSHVYLNVWTGNVNWLPHHWVYGLLMIVFGIYFWPDIRAIYILSFGIGFFVSDLKDFIMLKFFEPDSDGPKKFWDID